MVGEQGDHVGLAAQHVVHEALERLLGADLDEGAAAFPVHGLQTLDPLHGRGDLQLEYVLDALDRGRVQLAGDVGHQRQQRLGDAQPVQHFAQRLAGRSHDPGVEGVADGDAHGLEALGGEALDGLLHSLAGAADYALVVRVDVGRHHVAVDLAQRLHDHVVGRHDRGHPAVVVHGDLGHLRAARGRRLQRVGEGHDAGGDQGAILAQRVAHDHVGLEAVLGHQLVEGRVHG